MYNKKYLVIGSVGHQYVDCIEWESQIIPNIVDYDVVIINVRSLTNQYLENVKQEHIEKIQTLLTRLLRSNGSIVILSDFVRIVKTKNFFSGLCTNYSWCPIKIGIIPESGTTIEILDEFFPKYFDKFKKWDYYFSLEGFSQTFFSTVGEKSNTKYNWLQNVYLQNRYGKMLSGLFSIEVYRQRLSAYPSTPDEVFGRVHLLPLIQELDDKSALNLILEDILGMPQSSLAPDWVDKINMPFIDKFNTDISELSNTISETKKKIQTVAIQKQEIESYKKLLYADGSELEDIFKKCLHELGAVVPQSILKKNIVLFIIILNILWRQKALPKAYHSHI
jgi:hypothetical protein